jgi:RNA polymerase sigma factor (sigma-70 family)
MEDGLLASRAAAGDLESFGQLYDQYLQCVYDFAWRTLGDAGDAAEASRQIMLRAARRIREGTGGATFRSWLFALAFQHVVPLAEARGGSSAPAPLHEEAYGSFEVPDPSRLTDPALVGGDHELAALVWEAATSLSARDRAVLDLHVRQRLDSAELAPILGVSKNDAANLITRMKMTADGVMASYVMARRGGAACPQLEEVLAPYAIPPFTDAARRAVDAHVKDCVVCGQGRARLVPPLEVYGALAVARAPLELKGDVWSAIAAGWSAPARSVGGGELAPFAGAPVGTAAALSLGGGGDYPGGYAPAASGGWGRNQILLFAAASAGLILFAFAAGFVAVNTLGDDNNGGEAVLTPTDTPTSEDTATPTTSFTPGVAVLTATPNLTPSATPVPTETPTLPPTETATTVPPTPTPTKPVGSPTRSGVRTATPTRTPKTTPTRTPTGLATPAP